MLRAVAGRAAKWPAGCARRPQLGEVPLESALTGRLPRGPHRGDGVLLLGEGAHVVQLSAVFELSAPLGALLAPRNAGHPVAGRARGVGGVFHSPPRRGRSSTGRACNSSQILSS